jgi:hypothetical protein
VTTGYHIVKLFFLSEQDEELKLPPGWKPFAADRVGVTGWQVLARLWVKDG